MVPFTLITLEILHNLLYEILLDFFYFSLGNEFYLIKFQKLVQGKTIVQVHICNFQEFYSIVVGQLTHTYMNKHVEHGVFKIMSGSTMDIPTRNDRT